MGLVAYHGKWDRPEAVGRQIQDDPAHQAMIREYLDRRARTPDKAEAQMKLAAWCDEKGLKEQAMAHYSEVTRIDPSRDAAWKHLGYKKQGTAGSSPKRSPRPSKRRCSRRTADKYWKPKLEKLREGLESKDGARRAKAEQGLTEVTDPRAVPMIWALFAWWPAAADRRGADARPDRWPFGVERAGRAGGLQSRRPKCGGVPPRP